MEAHIKSPLCKSRQPASSLNKSWLVLVLLLLILNGIHSPVLAKIVFPETIDNKELVHLMDLSSRELLEYGQKFDNRENTRNDALMYYSVLVGRKNDSLNRKERECVIWGMINLSFLYSFYYYDFEQAYIYLDEAEELAGRYDIDEAYPLIFLNKASIQFSYHDLGNKPFVVDDIIDNFRKAFQTAMKLKDWEVVVLALENMVEIKFNHPAGSSIEGDITEYTRSSIPDDVPLKRYLDKVCEAYTYYSKGDMDESRKRLDESLELIDTRSTPERYRIIALKDKSLCYFGENNVEDALSELENALGVARRHSAVDAEVELLRLKADIYASSGDDIHEKDSRLQYYQKKDSLILSSKLGEVSSLDLKGRLRKVNEYATSLAEKKRVQNIILLVCSVFLSVVVVLLVILLRKNRRLEFSNRKLYLSNVEALKREEEERQARLCHEQSLHEYSDRVKLLEDELQNYGAPAMPESDKEIASHAQETEESRENVMGCGQQDGRVIEAILKVMDQSDIISKDDFTLQKLSDLCGLPYKSVSQAINHTYSLNFKSFLTNYRIKLACLRFNNPEEYSNMTIEAVGESVGFKSRSAFVSAFKRNVGLSPSEYLREAKRSRL